MLKEPKGIRRRLAVLLAKILPGYKIRSESPIIPADIGNSPGNIMVCMPFNNNSFRTAVNFIPAVKAAFPLGKFILIIPELYKGWLGKQDGMQVFPLTEKDVNFLSLPNRKLCRTIRQRNFKTAVDLNTNGILFSSILCAASGARVRIGFYNEHSDLFFNFQIRPKSFLNPADCYRVLLNYLK